MFALVIEARPLDGYRVRLRFKDGSQGIVNVAKLIPFKGVFRPLKDPKYFHRLRVDTEADHLLAEWRRHRPRCAPFQGHRSSAPRSLTGIESNSFCIFMASTTTRP